MVYKWIDCKWCVVVAALLLVTAANAAAATGPGNTRVAQWKDDKKAVFMLMFDDSIPTDIKNVIPELQKRKMIGTFYVNPGSGQWARFKSAWETEIPATGMEYANHTWDHKGAKDADDLESEIGKCNDVILKIIPGTQPRLLSFGQPGVPKGAWNVTREQLVAVLEKHHLVERPAFSGHAATINFKSAADILKGTDDAIAKGGQEWVVFHGVGGDWIVFPLDQFNLVLDGLAARADQLWIAGTIQAYKYETERKDAQVEVKQSDARHIQLVLTSKTDPALFDFPLTLVTAVPADWKRCEVTQGDQKIAVVPVGGVIRYDALANGQAVTITATPASN